MGLEDDGFNSVLINAWGGPAPFPIPYTGPPVTVENVGGIQVAAGPSMSAADAGPITTDANTLLLVYLEFDGAGASISLVTWAGVTCISVGAPAHNPSNNLNVQFFYLLNPATGSQTLAVTGISVAEYYYNNMVYHNVNGLTPIRPGSYLTGIGNSLAINSDPSDLTASGIEASTGTSSTNQTGTTSGGGTFSAGNDHATVGGAIVTHTWVASGNVAMAGLSVMHL